MRVSVVIPVYNPGGHILDLIRSLRDQTLDRDEWEAVFVDDGSTDETPALLDRLAAETPNFVVRHEPNSGWPGRPRNVGIDIARGDYVFLCDHDDRLAPTALQALVDFADANGSDVVVGKIVGVGRSAPVQMFRETIVDAQDDLPLLFNSLTPQRLYRTDFLRERDIRFPEGRRRLEDHLFVTKAYLRAHRVSIYADEPVYYFVLRDDGLNASRSEPDWTTYYSNAAESVAVVDEEAPSEALRLQIRGRWLRREALLRVRGARFLDRTDGSTALFDAVRDFIVTRYTPEEVAQLPPHERVCAQLVVADDLQGTEQFARWESGLRLYPRAVDLGLDQRGRGPAVTISVSARSEAVLPAALSTPDFRWLSADDLAAGAFFLPGAKIKLSLRRDGSDDSRPLRVGPVRFDDHALTMEASLSSGATPLTAGSWSIEARVTNVAPVPKHRVPTAPLRADPRFARVVGRTSAGRVRGVRTRNGPRLQVGGSHPVTIRLRRVLRRHGPIRAVRRLIRWRRSSSDS